MNTLFLAAALTTPLTTACLEDAGYSQGVHPDILWAIAMVEQGTVGQTTPIDGYRHDDIGLFQISNINIPTLADYGLSYDLVLHDGCMNALGAAILVKNRVTSRHCTALGDTVEMRYINQLACYHSWNPEPRLIYGKKLLEAFQLQSEADEQ